MLRLKMSGARRLMGRAQVAALLVVLSGCDVAPRLAVPEGREGAESTTAELTTPYQADAQREDLDAFVRGFFEVDVSYSPEARAEARNRLEELRRDAGAISDTQFVLRLSQIGALADNGHTGVIYRGRAAELGRVPIRLLPFGEDFVVVQAVAEQAGLLGGRLVAIDSTPIEKLREVARSLTGGVVSRRDQMAPPFLESPGQLHALELARAPEQATYVFEMRDGTTSEAVLSVAAHPAVGDSEDGDPAVGDPAAGAPAVANPAAGDRVVANPEVADTTMSGLSPESAPEGWSTLLPPKKAPWALQEIGKTMRRRDLRSLSASLIQLRAISDGDQPIGEFLDEAEAARRKYRRRNVILDLRMNEGGDLTTMTREWMSGLPDRLPKNGRVVILTSPLTFSAAISIIGYVKQAGGSRVVLVGEAPGDRLTFFAEGEVIVLPNSGARVQSATERHDYRAGCQEDPDCQDEVVEFPIEMETLEPDVKAPWTLDAYVKGRDPGMDAASRVLRGRR